MQLGSIGIQHEQGCSTPVPGTVTLLQVPEVYGIIIPSMYLKCKRKRRLEGLIASNGRAFQADRRSSTVRSLWALRDPIFYPRQDLVASSTRDMIEIPIERKILGPKDFRPSRAAGIRYPKIAKIGFREFGG